MHPVIVGVGVIIGKNVTSRKVFARYELFKNRMCSFFKRNINL